MKCVTLLGMGVIVTPQPTIGAVCADGEGVFWPVGETPEFVRSDFAFIVKCPISAQDPPNGSFILKQSVGSPCRWDYQDVTYLVQWFVNVATTHLHVVWFPNPQHEFFQDTQNHPTLSYANDIVACGPWNMKAKDGFGLISIF